MTNRDRLRLIAPGAGLKQRYIAGSLVVNVTDPQTAVGNATWSSRCVDVSGQPGQDHPLTITERDDRGFRALNGIFYSTPTSSIMYSNWLQSKNVIAHATISTPTVGEFATTLRARTNPSREEVSIPNFLYELKDLPGMIRNLKNLTPLLRNLSKRHSAAASAAASQYLGYEFGWKPLVSDISQLLQFQAQVDRRIVELNRLYSGKGLKRRLNLFDSTTTEEFKNFTFESSLGFLVRNDAFRLTRKRVWGTIRWMPTVVPRDIGHQALGRQARKLVHGMGHLGVDAVQAWNALPFTWLADWYGNFGEYLAAHRNDVPAVPLGASNIMTLTETYEQWVRVDTLKDVITGYDGMRILRTKERAQSSGTLSVHLPLATARQFSILAALNLQRKKR